MPLPTLRSNFYPRPPRGGRLQELTSDHIPRTISIPALREEGDILKVRLGRVSMVFLSPPSARRATINGAALVTLFLISIPALREEGDTTMPPSFGSMENFYPRPPRGGRQDDALGIYIEAEFLSPPSARRATEQTVEVWLRRKISIPALREEGDDEGPFTPGQSIISIPALREEGDIGRAVIGGALFDFYPRPPRGGRHQRQWQLS